MSIKQKARRTRIYSIKVEGNVVAFVRDHSQREAQAWYVRERLEAVECSTEDLISIGRDGAQVIGMSPAIDPNQQDLPL